ncbi:Pro-kumamolisin, activation domain-containing protein [Mycena capillaripes]|nr:Pro-kumamolisin, activation domain-containing protein [Mycena capillaripes]
MHPALFFLAFLLTKAPGALAGTVVHEKRVDHPSLIHSRRLEGHVSVPLKIGLKQKNTEHLADHLLFVSDPQSPYFGRHWSPEKIADVFAPANETRDAVSAWLSDAGFGHRLRFSHNKAWIHVEKITVDEVEALLDTEYHVYTHESGEDHAACDSYSLPEHIAHHIDIITPTVQPNINPAGCDQTFTPSCIRSLYNMTYVPKATDRNSFGIVSQTPSTYLQSDLDTFFANFSLSLVGMSPLFISIDGGIVDAVEGTDVGEDGRILQYTMALVEGRDHDYRKFLSFNEFDAVTARTAHPTAGTTSHLIHKFPNLPIGDYQEYSCGTVKPPYVISNSRVDFEYRLSPFYTRRQCNEFAKLEFMGVTVLFSAGNFGAAGTTRGYCLDDNGSVNLNATHFNPGWPEACPWITSRAYPDISANANNFVAVEEGGFFLNSGTSGAAPTVTSIITLVNNARLVAGKSPVGQGDRGGGFQAVSGWDPTSGVGTPNMGILIEKWLALP